MAIKVVKPPCKLYFMQCPWCYAELEYEFEDIDNGTIKCPCCNNYVPTFVHGRPVYKKVEDVE